jgi:response regulator RpfG family c-di-GMP phosphodiesterase
VGPIVEKGVVCTGHILLIKDVLPSSQIHLVEVAALLHDVGKLGVPDSVLLKPGPLNDEERLVMDAHDRLGVQITISSLGSAEVARYVECHHAHFTGNPRHPDLPTGQDIPLPSRIIAIVDAFDAMTSDRPYRKAGTRADAFDELRRCAGRQFDGQLVEQFIMIIAQPFHDTIKLNAA